MSFAKTLSLFLSFGALVACSGASGDPVSSAARPSGDGPGPWTPGASSSGGVNPGIGPEPAGPDGGGGADPGNVAYGTVAGKSLTAAGVAYVHSKGTNELGESVRKIVLSLDEKTGLCGRLANGIERPSSKVLLMTVTFTNINGPTEIVPAPGKAIAVGTHTDANFFESAVAATFFDTDANCKNTLVVSDANATSGSISFDSFDESHVKGRFDLHFPNGRFSGFFDTAECGAGVSQGAPVCQP